MKRYCVDNMVLGWGLKGVASPGQEGMVARARFLLDELDKKGAIIIVPAPVLTEFFHEVEPADKPAALQAFEKRFVVAPFDAQAAAIADELWLKVKEDPHLCPELEGPCVVGRIPKRVLKYDVQIVAIALANKVDGLYSSDHHVQTIANGRVSVLDMPEVKEQGDLFKDVQPPLRLVPRGPASDTSDSPEDDED